MTDEEGPRHGGSGDGARTVEPGAISRLLFELAQAPEDDLASSWREPLEPGAVVGRYQIRREIGRGGFGAVYEAFDPQLGRTVALKALKPGRSKHPVSEEWIQKEAEAVAKLDHSAIVTIFDVGTCPAGAYLVMELLRGETLAKRIEHGPLQVDEALRIAEQMAEGLAHAHSRGVLHRDLKPANVFVCEDGRVKLLDFGLAHLLGTGGSSGAGTPAYMAPEQAAGAAVDERADVWAAGMVLGEMLTGRRPVDRTPTPAGAAAPDAKTELMWEAPKEPVSPGTPPALARVPRPVAKAVGAALSEDPTARPKDGKAWLSELRSARRRVERPRRIRRVTAFATAFVVLGLAVAGFATWRIWERQIPGGRPTVAVADFVNETGDPELDGISGLLITSLEQGTQLRVLTRGRMLDILKQLGKRDVQRIDERLAREVGAQARANALLLATIRRLGDAFVVEMRALDPLHDEYIFTVSDRASGKAAVFDLVDRLGAATRRKLGMASGESRDASASVASITTASPKAWELLFRARQAYDQGRVKEAGDLARQALAEDPEFALAHLLVAETAAAVLTFLSDPSSVDEARRLVGEVARRADRLPEKERLSLQALRAQLDGSWVEAFRLRDRVAEAYPLDKEAQFNAGDVRLHRFESDSAIPYFQRALQLDPGYGLAVAHLAEALAHARKAHEHEDWLRKEAAVATGSEQLFHIASALLTAGQEEEAVATFRKWQREHGGVWPPDVYALYLNFKGRTDELEEAIRQTIEAVPADRPEERQELERSLSLPIFSICLTQGRFAEWWQFLQSSYPVTLRNPVLLEQQRVWLGQLTGNPDLIREALARLDRLGALDDPDTICDVGSGLALSGLFALAAPLVERAMPNPRYQEVQPSCRFLLEVSLDWARGNLDAAERKLAAAEASPAPNTRYGALVMGAQLARHRGDCQRTVAALEEVRAIRFFSVAVHTFERPIFLHALALCYEKLGDLPRARERNAEMLRLWAKADPDLPMLAEAKALQARLAAPPAVSR